MSAENENGVLGGCGVAELLVDPLSDTVVVVLFAADKAMRDVFYDSVGTARTGPSMEDRERRKTIMTEQPIGKFAPADDVFAALESIPGIDDDRAERDAARGDMNSSDRRPDRDDLSCH